MGAQMQAHEVIDRVWLRQPCCGATSRPCDERRPIVYATGCETCGHPQSCHDLPDGVYVRFYPAVSR